MTAVNASRTIHNTTSTAHVTQAIERASVRTGVDFAYLMDRAQRESSLNPTAQAKGSSARGLYQFIEKTWLQMVRDHGAEYGLGRYAKAIDGNFQVADRKTRAEILKLRDNPQISSYMAAEYAADNKRILESKLGGGAEIGADELALAHFFGPSGAAKFIAARDNNPDGSAAALFPREARFNRGVFYETGGQPRSMAEVAAHLTGGDQAPADEELASRGETAPSAELSTADKRESIERSGSWLDRHLAATVARTPEIPFQQMTWWTRDADRAPTTTATQRRTASLPLTRVRGDLLVLAQQ